jgi:hypothetical protein
MKDAMPGGTRQRGDVNRHGFDKQLIVCDIARHDDDRLGCHLRDMNRGAVEVHVALATATFTF